MTLHSSAVRGRRTSATTGTTAVVLGALAGTVAWAILDAARNGLTQPGFGGQAAQPLEAFVVVVASLLGGLLGWATLMVVERVLHRDRRTWLAIMSAALILSLAGPLSGTGVTAGDRLALVLLHLTVAAVVVPLLYRSTGAEPDRTEPL